VRRVGLTDPGMIFFRLTSWELPSSSLPWSSALVVDGSDRCAIRDARASDL
jgi:hypothetical protein